MYCLAKIWILDVSKIKLNPITIQNYLDLDLNLVPSAYLGVVTM